MKKIKRMLYVSLLSPFLIFSTIPDASAHHKGGHGSIGQETIETTEQNKGNGRNKHTSTIIVDEESIAGNTETVIAEPVIETIEEPQPGEVTPPTTQEQNQIVEEATLLGYSITGRGWGHSVGMTQWGAKGMAEAGYSYQDIIQYYYTGVAISKINTDNVTIRVALSLNIPTAYVMGLGTYQIVDAVTNTTLATFNQYTTTAMSYSNGMYVITNGDNTIYTSNPFKITSNSSMYHKGVEYLGDFQISNSIYGNIDVINHIGVETYLTGVVPHEIYTSWPAETIKAQTLAARTYALKNRVPTRKFDVYDTVASQVYKGISVVDVRINSLIELTRGEVILYNGYLIDALYSASAGGHTIDSGDIWSPTPYLVGKPDPYDQSPYIENWWEASFTLAELSRIFPEVGNVTSIAILETKYNRPTKLSVTGENGELMLTGYQFRERIGYDKMFSSTFTLIEIK